MDNIIYSKIVVAERDSVDGESSEAWMVTQEINGFACWRGTMGYPEMVEWFHGIGGARERAIETAVAGALAELEERRREAPRMDAELKERQQQTIAKLGEIRRELAAGTTT